MSSDNHNSKEHHHHQKVYDYEMWINICKNE